MDVEGTEAVLLDALVDVLPTCGDPPLFLSIHTFAWNSRLRTGATAASYVVIWC